MVGLKIKAEILSKGEFTHYKGSLEGGGPFKSLPDAYMPGGSSIILCIANISLFSGFI